MGPRRRLGYCRGTGHPARLPVSYIRPLQATNRRSTKKEAILISRFFLPLLAGAFLFAQDPSANPQPPDLKAFLSLTDSQIQALVQLQQQKAQALQPVVE